MYQYDGTALSVATFTGGAVNPVSYVHAHRKRIYMIERDTQKFHYGGAGLISGGTNVFDLSTTGRFGGNLFIAATISASGGKGPQDLLALIFTSGDVVVYEGSDPGSLTDWNEVGVFKIGRPLSRRGVLMLGNDVVILTERGYESLRVALPLGYAQPRNKLISEKIQQEVTDVIRTGGATDEWSLAIYPAQQMLMVQLPLSAGWYQHVRNVNTGAWCKFSGLNATAWLNFGTTMFFGTKDGRVCWFDGSSIDNGAPIKCDAQTAWDFLGVRAQTKQHTMQYLEFDAYSLQTASISLGVDFAVPDIGPSAPISAITGNIALWDSAEWDVSLWSPKSSIIKTWVTNGGVGRCSSMRVVVNVTTLPVAWAATTYLWIRGGLL